MRIESSRRKIINHDFVQGQGNPPSCQKFATSTTRQASSWTANFFTLGWISLSLYKVVVDSYSPEGLLLSPIYMAIKTVSGNNMIGNGIFSLGLEKVCKIGYSCTTKFIKYIPFFLNLLIELKSTLRCWKYSVSEQTNVWRSKRTVSFDQYLSRKFAKQVEEKRNLFDDLCCAHFIWFNNKTSRNFTISFHDPENTRLYEVDTIFVNPCSSLTACVM